MMASGSSTAIDRKSLTVQSKGGFPADGSLLDRYVFHVVRWPTIDCIGRHCPWTLGVQFKPLPPPFRISRVVRLLLFPLVSHPSLHHSLRVGGGDLPLSLPPPPPRPPIEGGESSLPGGVSLSLGFVRVVERGTPRVQMGRTHRMDRGTHPCLDAQGTFERLNVDGFEVRRGGGTHPTVFHVRGSTPPASMEPWSLTTG